MFKFQIIIQLSMHWEIHWLLEIGWSMDYLLIVSLKKMQFIPKKEIDGLC
jgi:hypothetical protein